MSRALEGVPHPTVTEKGPRPGPNRRPYTKRVRNPYEVCDSLLCKTTEVQVRDPTALLGSEGALKPSDHYNPWAQPTWRPLEVCEPSLCKKTTSVEVRDPKVTLIIPLYGTVGDRRVSPVKYPNVNPWMDLHRLASAFPMELYFMDELTSEEGEEGCEWPSDELPDLASSETDTSETYSDEEYEEQDQDHGYSIPLEFLSPNEAPLELAVGPPSPTGPLKLPAYSPSDEEACAFPDDGIMADNRHVRLSSLVDSTNLTTEQYGQLPQPAGQAG